MLLPRYEFHATTKIDATSLPSFFIIAYLHFFPSISLNKAMCITCRWVSPNECTKELENSKLVSRYNCFETKATPPKPSHLQDAFPTNCYERGFTVMQNIYLHMNP